MLIVTCIRYCGVLLQGVYELLSYDKLVLDQLEPNPIAGFRSHVWCVVAATQLVPKGGIVSTTCIVFNVSAPTHDKPLRSARDLGAPDRAPGHCRLLTPL